MNKTQREPWRALTRVMLPKPFDGYMGLCHFCKYAKWTGECLEAELECMQPLWKISEGEHPIDVWNGSDCWGFRPKYDLDASADVVGVYLQGQHPDYESIRGSKR